MARRSSHSMQAFRKSRGYRLGTALKRLHIGLTAQIEERLRADGMDLTRPQAISLMLLAEHPGASNAALARLAAVSPQTMHQMLLRLEREGLVARRPHASLKRVVCFDITPSGLDQLDRGSATARTVLDHAFGKLRVAEQTQLIALLERCVESLPPQARKPTP